MPSKKMRAIMPQKRDAKREDLLVGTVFVSAISLLLLVAGYVIYRLSGERAYRQKWRDYDDCGWA